MSGMVMFRSVALFLALMVTVVPHARAQGGRTANLRGTVRDPQSAAIRGATIDIQCGSIHRQAITNESGQFAEGGLPFGTCTITAVSPRFQTSSRTLDLTGDSTPITIELQVAPFAADVVVTPNRGVEKPTSNVPDSTSVTTREEIDSRPFTLLAQVLREEPGVLVQQTTSAQVSPIIRGFTGQSNVYLIDGVRLNTASWRSGPSQYLAWVEGAAIDRIEVVRGAGSVQYGSDALGGSVNLMSGPGPFIARGLRVGAMAELSAGSADESAATQGELSIRAASATIRVGGSRRAVGNLRAGGGIDSHSALTRYFGLPSTIVGTRMPDTSYDQGGGFVVASIGAGTGATIRGLYMHQSQTGASRYDRVLGGQGVYRSGFDPQELDFGYVRYETANVRVLDGISASVSVNRQADGRFEQARPTARLDTQEATTSARGYQLQGQRALGTGHFLLFGSEIYDEEIGDASRRLVDMLTGAVQQDRPDIANGTTYNSAGVFVQETADLVPNRLRVRGGLRFDRFSFATVPDPRLGVTEEHVIQKAVTFQVASVIRLTDRLNATVGVSKGFRAANAADFGEIGLSGGAGFSITPSKARELGAFVGTTTTNAAVSTGQRFPALGPEHLYQYEVGLKADVGRFSGSVSGFDMEFYDFIQRRALVFDTNVVGTTISGYQIVRQDANGLAYIAEDIRPVIAAFNADRARIKGMDMDGQLRLSSSWTAIGYFSMADGRLLATDEYVRRMPPPLGGARLRWSHGRGWVEGALTFAGKQTHFNSGDLSDARIGAVRTRASIATFFNGTATDMGLVQNGVLLATGETLTQVQNRVLGTAASAPLFAEEPGFAVIGLRAGYQITRHVNISAIGENLGDVNYRLYGSGVDAPGANVQVRLRVQF
jgi:outer membrane receptor protein involved in Fe transport